jgi:hypothetical protein
VKVELIIEMTDWMAGKFEEKRELGRANNRCIDTDNSWAMLEEQTCIVHEEKQIYFPCSFVALKRSETFNYFTYFSANYDDFVREYTFVQLVGTSGY